MYLLWSYEQTPQETVTGYQRTIPTSVHHSHHVSHCSGHIVMVILWIYHGHCWWLVMW